jgi:ribonuclease H / adenosylcobalamin/alpha-ribazole phosphatase
MVPHGVTDFTTAGRLEGRGGPDPSLGPKGIWQASAAGARVVDLTGDNAPRVITSNMKRAIETGAAASWRPSIGQSQPEARWSSSVTANRL